MRGGRGGGDASEGREWQERGEQEREGGEWRKVRGGWGRVGGREEGEGRIGGGIMWGLEKGRERQVE